MNLLINSIALFLELRPDARVRGHARTPAQHDRRLLAHGVGEQLQCDSDDNKRVREAQEEVRAVLAGHGRCALRPIQRIGHGCGGAGLLDYQEIHHQE